TLLATLNLTCEAIWVPETFDDRLAITSEAVALAKQLGDPVAEFFASGYRAWACVESADLDQADVYLRAIVRLAEQVGHPFLRYMATYQRAWRVLLDGQIEEAEALARSAFEIGAASGQPEATLIFGIQLFDVRRHQDRAGEVV